MEEKKRLYGHYIRQKCPKNTRFPEKIKLVKDSIDRLLKSVSEWDVDPDFDTMQFIIHEEDYCQKDLDWYAVEQGLQKEKRAHCMTVAVKFRGEELDPMERLKRLNNE